MGQVLILDDEPLMVQTIKKNINWEACGVTGVFLCCSAKEAMELLAGETIDLVVSDIEMPGTDGLSFAAWLRKHAPDTPIIFLTAHAEFEYAQAAIKLRAEDYLLKPVKYPELEEKIAAVLKDVSPAPVISGVSSQKNGAFGEFVRYMRGTLIEPCGEELVRLFEQFDLDFSGEEICLAIYLKFRDGVKLSWDSLQQLRTSFEALWSGSCEKLYSTSFSDYSIFLCVRYAQLPAFRAEEVGGRVGRWAETVDIAFCCFVSEPVPTRQFIPVMRRIFDRASANVLYQKQTIVVTERDCDAVSTEIEADAQKWLEYLENMQYKQLESAANLAVHRVMVSGAMDASKLQVLYHTFIQVMYAYIGQHFKEQRGMIHDEKLSELQQRAPHCVDDFKLFVTYFIDQLEAARRKTSENDLVAIAQKYIDEHLTDKIKRTDVAEHVALSENYLSKLFHRETGYSLSDYILEKRIALAKKLLSQTKLSISDIGAAVGYDASAHFIRMFKREVGKTPKEYRKDWKEP